MLSINEIIKKTRVAIAMGEVGLTVEDYEEAQTQRRLRTMFGHKFMAEREAEIAAQESFENRHLKYREEDFERQHLKSYWLEDKPILEIISDQKLPLELYRTKATSKWQDKHGNEQKDECVIYRLADTETKYVVDYEVHEDDYAMGISGKAAHWKYISAAPEEQKGWYYQQKTQERVFKTLYGSGILYCHGWVCPGNDKPVRTNDNWREEQVYGRDRYGNRSEEKHCKLTWLYRYGGWLICGEKQGYPLVMHLSQHAYEIQKKTMPDLLEKYRFARNFNYE